MSSSTSQFGNLNIGQAAAEEFARPPLPELLFARRAGRVAALAEGHPAAGFLRLMSRLFAAQAEACEAGGEVEPISEATIAKAAEHRMPLVSPSLWTPTKTYRAALRSIVEQIDKSDLPQETLDILAVLSEATDDHLDSLARAYLTDGVPPDWHGPVLFAVAALQVEFARIASGLDKDRLTPLDAAGHCPVCGSNPVAGVVVADQAHGRRFLTCGLCSTSWHHVRVKCISCGADDGIAYQEIEGGDGVSKCETCDECKSYSKIFYQTKNMAVEALADDLATLSLDLMVQEAGWKRHATNPFVLAI
jgi:FdhE protein